ncbi:MAG: molybdopterin-dependent oxidoreductase [Methermicoccaceae archaeon]
MKSVCPGCNFGCGVFIEPDEPCGVRRHFRKGCEVNEGKLCKFGVQLPSYYLPLNQSRVDGKEVALEEAVEQAAQRLSAAEGVQFVSCGGAPSEEMLALLELARAKGATLQSGLGVLSAMPEEAYPSLITGSPYGAVESAKTVVVVGIDPHQQYPLILRRLLKAKKNGAKVVFAGWKDPRGLADECVLLSPSGLEDALKKLSESLEGAEGDVLVVSELQPLMDAAMLAGVLNLAKGLGAKLLLLKPFANLTGMLLLMTEQELSQQKSFSDIIVSIEEGETKALVLYEFDPLEALPDTERVKGALEKLELLVVLSSRPSPVCELAHVVVAPEQFWQKKGVVVNNEGRVLELGGEGTEGFSALSKLTEACAGSPLAFEDAHTKALSACGVQDVDEYSVPQYDRPEYPEVEVEAAPAPERALVLAYTPLTWRDREEPYVVLSRGLAMQSALARGNLVELDTDGVVGRYPFSLGKVSDGVVLTSSKLAGLKETLSELKSVKGVQWYEPE